MILAILAIWFGYKKARDTGRNPFLWAAICGVTFIGVQLLVSVGFGVLIAIGIEAFGWKETAYDDYSLVGTLFSIGASIVALILLFRYLDRVTDDGSVDLPPPPPIFEKPTDDNNGNI